MTTTKKTWKTRAAFMINGRWTWATFTSETGNKHAAIIAHGKLIGASGWDFGTADHMPLHESNF